MSVPQVITTIKQQIGTLSLMRVGASKLTYCNKGFEPSFVSGQGCVSTGISLEFSVNGKRGRNWKIIVSLEPCDTYTVYLWQSSTPKQRRDAAAVGGQPRIGEVIDQRADVYCEELGATVEAMYDAAINKYCGGFIPMH